MTELEKLDAGLEYDFWDEGVNARKLNAVDGCKKLNANDSSDEAAVFEALTELFGTVGENATVLPVFNCDNGKNIHVGKNFLANYNVTILPGVTIGNCLTLFSYHIKMSFDIWNTE